MVTYETANSVQDLTEIIALQKENLKENLADIEIQAQGFVTVCHALSDLEKMQQHEKSLVVKDQNRVVGYILAMTKNSRSDIPILIPMFQIFDAIYFNEKTVSAYNYMVVGQVCIGKDYRGLGIFDKAYTAYKALFKERYDFGITEIATANHRSMQAHKRIGFMEIHRYIDENKIEWSIVVWDWN
jgi:small-conductance mechanosensitive channel